MWVLRDCWSAGVIDENTLVWGQGLADWLPAKNVNMLIPQIRNFEGAAPMSAVACCGSLVCAGTDGVCATAVRMVTFLKKHLSLKPALRRSRKAAGLPELEYSQLDNMY